MIACPEQPQAISKMEKDFRPRLADAVNAGNDHFLKRFSRLRRNLLALQVRRATSTSQARSAESRVSVSRASGIDAATTASPC
jgi:hypothetical protein